MKLKFKKLCENAVVPKYAHPGEDACFDISVLIDSEKNSPMVVYDGKMLPMSHKDVMEPHYGISGIAIPPHSSVVFHTGLSFEIETGYVMKVYVRSSTGIKKGLILSNGTGIIDSSYRGELLVSLYNTTDSAVAVDNLDRLCQAEITKVENVEIEEAEVLSETSRGEGGFGSTGNN